MTLPTAKIMGIHWIDPDEDRSANLHLDIQIEGTTRIIPVTPDVAAELHGLDMTGLQLRLDADLLGRLCETERALTAAGAMIEDLTTSLRHTTAALAAATPPAESTPA